MQILVSLQFANDMHTSGHGGVAKKGVEEKSKRICPAKVNKL